MINRYASTLLNSTRMVGIQILIYKFMPKAVVFCEKLNSVIAFNRRLKFSSWLLSSVVVNPMDVFGFRMTRRMSMEELWRAPIDDGRDVMLSKLKTKYEKNLRRILNLLKMCLYWKLFAYVECF